jgi:hypothetical protein
LNVDEKWLKRRCKLSHRYYGVQRLEQIEHRQSFKQAAHATSILNPAQITTATQGTPWVIQAMICSTSQRFDVHYEHHDAAVAQNFWGCVVLRILPAMTPLFLGASLSSEASVGRFLTFTFFPSHS